ncbi:AAA family ATPase [uncultured Lacinutrix sp.]|uniref:ATP-dependent nuclease n=1 Tax=uncultured Lacinutrix sp. TaxID=574032 RepID=UPI00261D781D|nr:AAA family ATPase [uncultured Lacinutrix sp.]
MKINKLKIKNWRSIIDEEIQFQDLIILIGQNNHGKSNVLSSILFFFGEIKIQQLDFNKDSDEIFVEIEFSDLNETEKITFQKYVSSENTITVRKTAKNDLSLSYNGFIQEPKLDWLKESNVGTFSKREEAEKLPLKQYLPVAGRITKTDFITAQQDYVKANFDKIKFDYKLEETNFLGATNVAKGIFGDLFFIPSIKNASDELNPKGNSFFGQLYTKVINRISENNPEFIDAKKRIIELSKILNKTDKNGGINKDRPKELTSLEGLLDDELKSWDTKIDIQITPPNVEDIFKVGANVSLDDGIKTDITRKGHGLQRALIFALIKAWAKVLKLEREEQDKNESSNRKASKSTYFIFEEPELFLHPQAQKELFASLINLSNEESQVVLCTHSSSFLDLNYHKSICIVKKENIEVGTKVLQFTNDIFEENEDKKQFNLSYWINPERSELFFAKKVILVEGQTDKTILPMLAKDLDIFRYDFTIIDCGSKDSIPLYINLLNKFKIKYCVVYDKDHQEGKSDQAIKTADKITNIIEDIIDIGLGKSMVLVNDIEEELGMFEKGGRNKAYAAINFINSDKYALSNSFRNKIISVFSE